MRRNVNVYFALTVLFIGLIIMCRPSMALAEIPLPTNPPSPTMPGTHSDVFTPKEIDSMPDVHKATEFKTPSGEGETSNPQKPITVPSQTQSNTKSIEQPLHTSTNIPYPDHRTPSGSGAYTSTGSQPVSPATFSSSTESRGTATTPKESVPGALKSNTTEYPSTPTFIPQGDPRPLNERPMDADSQPGSQRQFD